MHYVYILRSLKDKKLYIGRTRRLNERFAEHQRGETYSTKFRRPFKIIYYEAYLAEEDAKKREKFFKTGWGRNYIKRNLKNTLLA
jgi:putative endonuclease